MFFKPTRWNILFTFVLLIPVFFITEYFHALCVPFPGSNPKNLILPLHYSRQCGILSDLLALELEYGNGSAIFFIGFIFLVSYLLSCILVYFARKLGIKKPNKGH